jgi:hypothetical protein
VGHRLRFPGRCVWQLMVTLVLIPEAAREDKHRIPSEPWFSVGATEVRPLSTQGVTEGRERTAGRAVPEPPQLTQVEGFRPVEGGAGEQLAICPPHLEPTVRSD